MEYDETFNRTFKEKLEAYLEMAGNAAKPVADSIKRDLEYFLKTPEKTELDFGPMIHTYGPGICQSFYKAIITTLGKGYWPQEGWRNDYWPTDAKGKFKVVYEEREFPKKSKQKKQYLLIKKRIEE